ncbi:hypothetical protein KUTeg_019745 [Tegillarca granosa]|uniref:Transglutaminase-like domain-containing protein n=1 Tax=Tegillarca granosa TaxID=220873 RepID=A0ABQ9EDE1_TEGGR|nr:hypothetical protein KUTeg_019745 [Tegillarca granosa]
MSSVFGAGDMRVHYVRRTRNTFRVGGGRFLKPLPHWEGLYYRSGRIYEYGDGYDDSEIIETVSTPTRLSRAARVASELKIEKCHYNITKNTETHHTSDYSITEPSYRRDGPLPQLVVRRGQPFDVTLELTRPYDSKKDDLKLIFEFGKTPNPIEGTYVEIVLSDADEPRQWGAKIQDMTANYLTVTVFTPPTLYVGKWEFRVDIIKLADEENTTFRYNCSQPIYILFNPWCKDDTVYMENEKLLDEYILNDTGKIYVGNQRQIFGRKWNFGQFEDNILDCALYLLGEHEDAPLKNIFRGDPVRVTRALSALINCQDDNGVLVGNWSNNYRGGTSPLKWKGSVAILEQFYTTKQPVNFGQCWVFSGVVTTVCRALGIPARSVTNFESAHDTDGSITIDKICTSDGEKLENGDSVWNFHVWNDVWMDRPDLPKGYGGWQAMDATPQEKSANGLYCCGPFPLSALKRGEVNIPYDGSFIYAEVNADRVNWVQICWHKLIRFFILRVGKFISTKLPSCIKERVSSSNQWKPCTEPDWQDVTSEYKFEEGSKEERQSVKTANRKGSQCCKDVYDQPENADVKFELKERDCVMYGQNFEVTLKITNESKSERTVSGCINVNTVKYTGQMHEKVKKEKYTDVVVAPGESKMLTVPVTFDDYMEKLVEQCEFELCELFTVKETNQTSVENINFRLTKPILIIKAPPDAQVGKSFNVDVSFTNPLPVSLNCCELSIEGPGLQKPIVHRKRNVGSYATFTDHFVLTPMKKGIREILVSFNATEIEMIEGDTEILVKP